MPDGHGVGAEARRQLRSPITWLAMSLFAALSGWAFVTALNAFLDASTQALSAPPLEPVNVNQFLIRPFLLQVAAAALLTLPIVIAGTRRPGGRADLERRSPSLNRGGRAAFAGFVGAFAVYVVMLFLSAVLVATLFLFGAPDWGPIASGYLGLCLAGAAFIAVAGLIDSLATTAVASAGATWAIALVVAGTTWLAWRGTPTARVLLSMVSVGDGLNDFAKGVINLGYAVSCVAMVALGLFLSSRAIDGNGQPD